jgi:hypothetical protein
LLQDQFSLFQLEEVLTHQVTGPVGLVTAPAVLVTDQEDMVTTILMAASTRSCTAWCPTILIHHMDPICRQLIHLTRQLILQQPTLHMVRLIRQQPTLATRHLIRRRMLHHQQLMVSNKQFRYNISFKYDKSITVLNYLLPWSGRNKIYFWFLTTSSFSSFLKFYHKFYFRDYVKYHLLLFFSTLLAAYSNLQCSSSDLRS